MQPIIPIHEKYVMSIKEASVYFHIGINKMRRLVSANKSANWVLWIDNRAQIKRKNFEKYIDSVNSI